MHQSLGRSPVLAMNQESNGSRQRNVIKHPMDAGIPKEPGSRIPRGCRDWRCPSSPGTWKENNRDAEIQGKGLPGKYFLCVGAMVA